MAKLFDMYYNSPAVDVSGTLRELNAGDQANRLRNRQTASDMLTRSAVNAIRSRFDADKSLGVGIPQADAEFNRAYLSMQAVSPSDAESMKSDYGVSRNRAVGRSLASLYGKEGQEGLLKGLVEQDPSAAASLITREKAIASGIKPEDRLQVEIRNLRATIASEGFKNFDMDYQKQKIAQLKELEAQQASSKYGNGDAESAQPSDEQSAFETARTEADAIIAGAVDADNNGTIDDEAARKTQLEDLIRKYGMAARDGDFLRERFQAKADEIAKVAKAKKEKEAEEYNRAVAAEGRAQDIKFREFSNYKDYLPSMQTVAAIGSDPTNQTNVQLGISELLKILSGTGVSDSERMNTILALTPTAYQQEIRGKGNQFAKAWASKLINLDGVALAEYASHVTPEKIAGELRKRIPKDAWAWAEKNAIKTEAPKPTTTKQGAAKSGSGTGRRKATLSDF